MVFKYRFGKISRLKNPKKFTHPAEYAKDQKKQQKTKQTKQKKKFKRHMKKVIQSLKGHQPYIPTEREYTPTETEYTATEYESQIRPKKYESVKLAKEAERLKCRCPEDYKFFCGKDSKFRTGGGRGKSYPCVDDKNICNMNYNVYKVTNEYRDGPWSKRCIRSSGEGDECDDDDCSYIVKRKSQRKLKKKSKRFRFSRKKSKKRSRKRSRRVKRKSRKRSKRKSRKRSKRKSRKRSKRKSRKRSKRKSRKRISNAVRMKVGKRRYRSGGDGKRGT